MSTSHMHTPEARAKAAASRSLAGRSTRQTNTPGSESCTWPPGTPVRVRRSGDLTRYTGRSGWVATVNTERYDNGLPDYTEVGVTWAIARDWKRAAADAWFRVDELDGLDGTETTPETEN